MIPLTVVVLWLDKVVVLVLYLKADVDEAVKAARAAFARGSKWRKLDPSKKGQLMNKLARLMRDNISYMAVTMCFILLFW